MRVTLLPREAAARVITGAIATLAWCAGASIILLTIPVLVETLVNNGLASALPLPLTMLVVILAAIAVALWRMTPVVVICYLVIAGTAAVVYESSLVELQQSLVMNELYLVNRPTLALVSVGVAASSAFGGIAWCLLGYGAAGAVAVVSALLTGTTVRPGIGPTMVLLLAIILYLTLFTIQARQRRRLPRFEELEAATRRRAGTADLASRTTAMVHDTVLNDLAVVMNAADALDQRTRDALAADLDTLEGGAWMMVTQQLPSLNERQARIRNELARIASDFRWRGLTINVTGVTSGVYLYDPDGAEALIGALRAAFENVLRHSGVATAAVEIVYTDTEVTFIVSDQGEGFDPAVIAADRLGVRGSIVARMEAAGGSARVWSSPGAGTTVMLTIPVTEVLDRGTPSRHRDAGHDDG